MDKNSKAVALKYDSDLNNAPKISSKGRGEIARKIIGLAKKNNIPVYEDKILIEILDKMEIGYEIPEFLFEVIAEIYAYTYRILKEEK